jgi:3-oxoadipate enol-lactonase
MARPAVDIGRERFNWRMEGPAGAATLVLSNSLGTNLAMWDAQVPALAQRFRVLRYDTRGHGTSLVTPGPYSIEQLARDVLALLDELKIAHAHFCGLSLGGMTGMWLGVHAPERLDRLVLCNTSPKIGPPEIWNARIEAVSNGGVSSIADAVLGRWFTMSFRERAPKELARMRAMLTATPADGYVAACAAIRDMDQWDVVARISRPTLVISGTHDVATPPADGRRVAEAIAGARYVELDAGHISNVEAPAAFTTAVLDFLTH